MPNDVMAGQRGRNVVMRTRSDWYPRREAHPIAPLLTSSRAAMVSKLASNAIGRARQGLGPDFFAGSHFKNLGHQALRSDDGPHRLTDCFDVTGDCATPIATRSATIPSSRPWRYGMGCRGTHRTPEAASAMPWFPQSALLVSSRCQRAPSSFRLSRTAFSSRPRLVSE